jgi:hypothetical protein
LQLLVADVLLLLGLLHLQKPDELLLLPLHPLALFAGAVWRDDALAGR